MKPASPLDGRSAAVLAVTDALTGRRFAGETLRGLRAGGQLAGREAGLALEIAHGALRHVYTIEYVLAAVARFEPRRTPAAVRAVLHAAAYQCLWMDRIPVFAAVDRAVDLAGCRAGRRAGGMVNAVLRKLTGGIAERVSSWEGLNPRQIRTGWERACTFNAPVLPATTDPAQLELHLAAAVGETPPRYRELVAVRGAEAAEQIAWASSAVPPTVVYRNSLRATPEALAAALAALDRTAAVGDEAGARRIEITADATFLPPAAPVVDLPEFAAGLLYVQDTTAHAAAAAVEAQPGERILDLCAAPGGKSVALALAMGDRGTIIACDPDRERLQRVEANIARLGLTCVQVRDVPDPAALRAAAPFDAALVDVPCSNTGVIARRPEARLGRTQRKLAALLPLQAELLRVAAAAVRPGGRVVYSTCSIEPAENENQVAAFLRENTGWQLEAEATTLPRWGPRLADWRDGGYYARLRFR